LKKRLQKNCAPKKEKMKAKRFIQTQNSEAKIRREKNEKNNQPRQ
jgi:hypothetical protein